MYSGTAWTKIVHFTTEDGLKLSGMYLPPSGLDTTIIHVHGKCGTFYENNFLHAMLDAARQLGLGFLAFNNRGAGCITEGYRNGSLVYIGGSLERFEDCLLDLLAAKTFALSDAGKVILQGHSYGCDKVLYFSQHMGDQEAYLLISPANSRRIFENYAGQSASGATPDARKPEIGESQFQLMPELSYGVSEGKVRYAIPISLLSYRALLKGPGLRLLDLASLKNSHIRTVKRLGCYIGAMDELNKSDSEDLQKSVRLYCDKAWFYLDPNGTHHIGPHARSVVDALYRWAVG